MISARILAQTQPDQFDIETPATKVSSMRPAGNAYRMEQFSAFIVRCLFFVALAFSIGLAGLSTGHAHTSQDDSVHSLDHADGDTVPASSSDEEDVPCGRGDPSGNCKIACEIGHCAGAAILVTKIFQIDVWSVQDRHRLSVVAPRQTSNPGFYKPPRS